MPHDIRENIMKMFYTHHVVSEIPTYSRHIKMNLKKKHNVQQLKNYTDIIDKRVRGLQLQNTSVLSSNNSNFKELNRLRNAHEYWDTIGLRIGNNH